MTPTLLDAPRRPSSSPRQSGRWAGVAFGLLAGVLVICHGCHLGDHDDELSVHGREVRKQDTEASGRRKPAGVGHYQPAYAGRSPSARVTADEAP